MKKKFEGLSGNGLKAIAVLSMFLDHIGAVLIENGVMAGVDFADMEFISGSSSLSFWWRVDIGLRMVGRMAFPIFAFLLVEGFLNTRDVKRYALRLLAFGILSEIPFDLAIFHTPFAMDSQNIYFTLFLSLLALVGFQKYENERFLWKQAAVLIACGCAATILNTDYGAFGVVFIVLLYMTRGNPRMRAIIGSLALIWEIPAILAFIPIHMYNGKRGRLRFKYLFYAAYPVHLLVLWGIGRRFIF